MRGCVSAPASMAAAFLGVESKERKSPWFIMLRWQQRAIDPRLNQSPTGVHPTALSNGRPIRAKKDA